MRRSLIHPILFAAIVVGILLPVTITPVAARDKGLVRVVDRVRLGTYVEETTYVTSGPHAGQIAMISGHEVWGVPSSPRTARDLRMLFDIRSTGITVSPKGMAYIESEGVFAFVSGGEPDRIHITDSLGNPQAPRPIGYPDAKELSLEAPQLVSIPFTLNSFEPVFDITAGTDTGMIGRGGIDYLPEERLIASLDRQEAEIELFTMTGDLVERISVAAFGVPRRIRFIPHLQQFAIVFGATGVTFLSRSGSFVRELDFAAAGIKAIVGLAFFDPLHPTGGQFLVFDNLFFGSPRAVVTDFAGIPLKEFDYRQELGVIVPIQVAPVTTGPYAGAFGVLDSQNQYELIVFRVN